MKMGAQGRPLCVGCIVVVTGPVAGEDFARLRVGSGEYVGKIRDPKDGAEYDGTMTIVGADLVLEVCVLGEMVCQTQTMVRL